MLLEPTFRDAARRDLVQYLVQRFTSVRELRSPFLLLLEAESGWGKTRLVHEFYKSLAAGQPEPAYWPPSIVGAVRSDEAFTGVGDRDPSLRRKLIYPQVVDPPPAAVPMYLWLGISGQQSATGAFLSVVDFELRQLDRHRDALVAAIAPSLPRRLQKAWNQGRRREFWEAIAGDLTSLAAGGVGIGVLPVGMLALLAKTALGGAKTLDHGSKSAVAVAEQLAHDISAFAHAEAGVPVILAIEDLQWADTGLMHLLTEVVGSQSGPVFVIATAVSGELTAEQMERLEEDVAPSRMARVDLASAVGPLTRAGRLALVEEMLEGIPRAQCDALVEKYENPYVLELVLTDRRVLDLAKSGRLSLDAIERLPSRVKDFWRRAFEQLDPDIQEVFALAVLSSPASISVAFSGGQARWDGDLPGEAMTELSWAAPLRTLLPEVLDDEAARRAWFRRRDSWVRFFHERAKFDVVRDLALERFGDDAADKAGEYWAQLARSIDLGDPSVDEARRLFRAEILVSVTMRGILPWSDEVIEGADLLIDAAVRSQDMQALRFAVSLAERIEDDDRERRAVRQVKAARCLQYLGLTEDAVSLLEDVIDDVGSAFGERSEPSFSPRLALGATLMSARRSQDAYDTLAALVEDEKAVLEADSSHLLAALGTLAEAAGHCGRFSEAAELYQAIIDRRVSLAGEQDEATIHDRTALISWLARVDPSAALEQARALLAFCEELFDGLSWSTIQARGTLAGCMAVAGNHGESVVLRRRVAAETGVWFGDRHRMTLDARWRLAHALRDTSPAEAVDVFREVCTGLTELLGHDHPDTLRARHHLVYTLPLAGEIVVGLAEALSLLSDCEQRLGPESELTIATREFLRFTTGIIDGVPEEKPPPGDGDAG